MRFGVSMYMHDVTLSQSYSDLLESARQVAAIAEEAGFDTIWLDEHHFSTRGTGLLPNPLLFAADIAARTERIRIGLSAAIITLWHPLRLAEDLAMLDHLSRGRVEIGVGRGNQGAEALNLNSIADPNDQMQNIEVFEETFQIMKLAMSEKMFSFKGKHYQFPTPGFRADRTGFVGLPEYLDPETNELKRLSIFPRALQKPHPVMWQVVNSIESIQHAARLDCGIIMWRPGIKSLQGRLAAYRDEYLKAHGKELPLGTKAAVVRDTYCARTEEQALEIAGDKLMSALNRSNWRGPSIYLDPDETLSPEEEASLTKHLPYDFVRDRCVWFGSPERIFDKVKEISAETNIENVNFKSTWPGLEHSHWLDSIRLIGREVLPALRAQSLGSSVAQPQGKT